MNFNITLNADQINTIFAALNELKHGQSRGTFDYLLQQVQAQEAAAKAPPAPDKTDAPTVD
jgi:hypothetical protein